MTQRYIVAADDYFGGRHRPANILNYLPHTRIPVGHYGADENKIVIRVCCEKILKNRPRQTKPPERTRYIFQTIGIGNFLEIEPAPAPLVALDFLVSRRKKDAAGRGNRIG